MESTGRVIALLVFIQVCTGQMPNNVHYNMNGAREVQNDYYNVDFPTEAQSPARTHSYKPILEVARSHRREPYETFPKPPLELLDPYLNPPRTPTAIDIHENMGQPHHTPSSDRQLAKLRRKLERDSTLARLKLRNRSLLRPPKESLRLNRPYIKASPAYFYSPRLNRRYKQVEFANPQLRHALHRAKVPRPPADRKEFARRPLSSLL